MKFAKLIAIAMLFTGLSVANATAQTKKAYRQQAPSRVTQTSGYYVSGEPRVLQGGTVKMVSGHGGCQGSCRIEEPSCYAEEPSCCAQEPTCCAEEVSCGCEPSCCEPSCCETRCCKRRHSSLTCAFNKFRSKIKDAFKPRCKPCCKSCCEPVCEESCGCADSYASDVSCGAEPACDAGGSCDISYGGCGCVDAAGQPEMFSPPARPMEEPIPAPPRKAQAEPEDADAEAGVDPFEDEMEESF